ncbi:MAG: ATP-binding protein [Phycisphaerales bacterium]|nr:ATP-binding protein [Phycisphaerales bacterium]
MRPGIRRKLIGMLMLVGLLPLGLSLVVILVGGAVMQLSQIRTNYKAVASLCADRVTDSLLRDEIKSLMLASREPALIAFLRDQNARRAAMGPLETLPGTNLPAPTARDTQLNQQWPTLKVDDPLLVPILNNPITDLFRRLHALDEHQRHIFLTNAYGQVVASEDKTPAIFHAGETWWQAAFHNGQGRTYISSITRHAGCEKTVIELAVPVWDPDQPQSVIGIIKDELDAQRVMRPLSELAEASHSSAQLIELPAGATVYAPAGAQHVDRARDFFLKHQANPNVRLVSLLFNDIIIGSARVRLQGELYQREITAPDWVVVVAKPSEEAMAPVYKVATAVSGIGAALILVLFTLGLAISNRKIIMPILRLREATAAVGRGELNVRLLADAKDTTFHEDELGDLAHDFDEMTRQLQRNVNQLARANEAKRRFMELAGHELKTPVTYLIGAYPLAQRQVRQLAATAIDAQPKDEQTIAQACKNAAAMQTMLTTFSTKTHRLVRIIDNLLSLVTNDQFMAKMKKSSVDVRTLLFQVTSDHRPFIAERKQHLALDIAEGLPPIEADKDKLEDALTNLVSNAIRFSPDGSAIRVAAHEITGDMLEILVEDSGPGIPQADLDHVFEPFYTGSDILHHHTGTFEFGSKGLGLGLAIVRRFIELHGGIVRAHALKHDPVAGSSVPNGTQFQILLPLNRDPELTSPSSPPQAPPPEYPDTPEHAI